MVITRLFKHLWSMGLVLVATSNTPPDELYANGIQRQSFQPFIDEVHNRCAVHDIGSDVDYRKLTHPLADSLVFIGAGADEHLQQAFEEISLGDEEAKDLEIPVQMGRKLVVPRARAGVALLSFSELCQRPLGAADYIALASNFHTVLLSGVRKFTAALMPETGRFITLVDSLYDKRARLGMAAESDPAGLFECVISSAEASRWERAGKDVSAAAINDQLAFSKERCISRLIDMQSYEFALTHAGLHAPQLVPHFSRLGDDEEKYSYSVT